MPQARINKINDQIQRELSAIMRQVKDARIPLMTSIIAVETTADLRYAKIYVSVMGSDEEQARALAGLQSAAGYMRRELGQRIKAHYTPELVFVIDHSIAYGAHINRILNELSPE